MDSRRLYQQVADRIRVLTQGPFPPGSRLPSERDLALQLGVSRPSLREALIALEIEGSVEIRMGSGVYVCVPKDSSMPTRSLGESPTELIRARAAIEGTVALIASARVTPDALAVLRATLDEMRDAIDEGRKPLAHDKAFHMAIAGLSGNSVLSRIVGELFDERHSPLSATISARFDNRETWTAALGEHQAIYDALESGDALLAQAMMHMHLQASNERWVTGSTGIL